MAKETKWITGSVVVSLLVIVGTATWNIAKSKGDAQTSHTATNMTVQNNTTRITQNSVKLDEHEKRLDATERMQTKIDSSQDRIEDKVDGQTQQIIELIKGNAETQAWLKSIEKVD